MAGSLGDNVRPTSFDAFNEVSAYVMTTGQAITIDQFYANKYASLLASGKTPIDPATGNALSVDAYVSKQCAYGYQSYYDGDFSAEGRFNKFV